MLPVLHEVRGKVNMWVQRRVASQKAPSVRGWIKSKNPNYWRRELEREAIVRSRERRTRSRV
jgi:hypothetical protein